MNIVINDHRKIFAIQEEFTAVFPNLAIEFHTKPSRDSGASPEHLVKHNKTLGECRTEHNKGTISITPEMTISELKEDFMDVYGLTIEIFQKSDGKRISAKGDHTLEEENSVIKAV